MLSEPTLPLPHQRGDEAAIIIPPLIPHSSPPRRHEKEVKAMTRHSPNSSDHRLCSSSGSLASTSLADIDEGLRNLSDTSDAFIPLKKSPHNNATISHTTSQQSPPPRTIEEICKQYAPPGMESAFQQLYRALLPCLSDNHQRSQQHQHQRSNASVFVQGPRGSGKSLLVQSCLRALSQEEPSTRFRPVFCTSLLNVPFQRHHPNAGAGAVVEEILRQLVEQQQQESSSSNNDNVSSQLSDLLRLRQTSFANHLQLLNEILQMASMDGIPVLFVLDNVTQFPPLLLYHLLDRIAGSGTSTNASNSYSLCLIGMTTHALTCLQTSGFVEKRIVSRVEGTSSLIHVPALSCTSQQLLNYKLPSSLHSIVRQIYENEELAGVLERQERMGQSARWFCRLFTVALASWREELRRHGYGECAGSDFGLYVQEALEDVGIVVNVGEGATQKQSHPSAATAILQDLSIPQLLLVLAARRILARSHHSKPSSSSDRASGAMVVLTLQGLLTEIMDKLYRGNPPPNATTTVLQRAFLDLMDLAVLRPACDHSGTGPFQYYEKESILEATSWEVLMRLPLHLTLDIYRDILPALENHELTAPTSILEWGKKLA